MPKLYFTHGTMGSQKTMSLLGAAHNYEQHGGNVLVTKPAADTKGDQHIVSRIGLSRLVDFVATPEMDIQAEVLRRQEERQRQERVTQLNALLVDEAQFLEPRQVDQLLALAVINKIPVLAYGLRTDFRTHTFPGSCRLLEVAHEIRESVSMCGHGGGCEHKAVFNARMVDGAFVNEGPQVAIDEEADVTYTALCAAHYMGDVGPIEAAA